MLHEHNSSQVVTLPETVTQTVTSPEIRHRKHGKLRLSNDAWLMFFLVSRKHVKVSCRY